MNAIANHLWQSTCFALCAALLVLMLRNDSARIRFTIWFVASLKFLIPFSWLSALGSIFSIEADQDVFLPLVREVAAPLHGAPLEMSVLNPSLILGVVVVWSIGSAILLAQWLMQWRHVTSLIARSAPYGSFRSLPICVSDAAIEPGLVGLFKPTILLSRELAMQLSAEQLQSICVHEWAHARRRDNIAAVAQMLVQSLFWFHPLVWWIGRQMLETREQACDEIVIGDGNDPDTYARSVLSACRYAVETRAAVTARASGGNLQARLKDILGARIPGRIGWPKRAVLGVAASATIALPVMAGVNVLPPLPTTLVLMPFASEQMSAFRRSDGGRRLFEVRHDRIVVRNLTLRELIGHAYGVDDSDVRSDVPWFDERYDIDVRLDPSIASDLDGQRRAIREALARHFNLQIFLNRRCEEPCGRAALRAQG